MRHSRQDSTLQELEIMLWGRVLPAQGGLTFFNLKISHLPSEKIMICEGLRGGETVLDSVLIQGTMEHHTIP